MDQYKVSVTSDIVENKQYMHLAQHYVRINLYVERSVIRSVNENHHSYLLTVPFVDVNV